MTRLGSPVAPAVRTEAADAVDAHADGAWPAQWWHALPDGRIQCDLCPRECKLHPGQRGLCFVRARAPAEQGGGMLLTTYGRSSGFCIDPIEKKPLNHFLPGSSVLSFGTAGCNLACKFCQNWDISKSREMDRLMDRASPERIAEAAAATGSASVAFTYNDPVIFAEYAIDAAEACRARGVRTVAVTAGYLHAEPRRAFFQRMDAANVDLKGFSEDFYFHHTGAHLAPVLDTLQAIAHETDCWLELTTLLIPGVNDGDAELQAMTRWVAEQLGPEVPLHFTAFHPDYRMTEVAPTPAATLQRARAIARDNGLRHVYTGNVHDTEGGTTFCQGCGQALIVRDWHAIRRYALDAHGACPHCGTQLAGRFGDRAGPGVPRRIPVRLAAL
jgi:pyruvate formate lyase activating enzyme